MATPIPIEATRSALRSFEQALLSDPNQTLLWTAPSRFPTPMEHSALMQTLITGGRSSRISTLQLGPRVSSPSILRSLLVADELLVALLVSNRVLRADGQLVNIDARSALSTHMTQRKFIDLGEGRNSIVLSTLDDAMSWSPDVMSGEGDSASTDLSARTQFFRVTADGLGIENSQSGTGSGEEIVEDDHRRRWLVRTAWPASHPLYGQAFSPLGDRVLRPTKNMQRRWQLHHPKGSSPSDWLGQVLWEIFQNTERHGMRSGGAPIRRAVRMLTSADVESDTRTDTVTGPFAAYIDRIRSAHGDATPISVTAIIDSGDGLAQTAAERARHVIADEADEIAYMKLAARGDSHSPDRPMRGFGMKVVATLLSETDGYMQIRSGSLSVWRDFGASPFSMTTPDSPLDWTFDLEDRTSPHRRAGSVVTIAIPRVGARQ